MIASRPARGFSLFELAVAAIIVGLLSVLLLSRLHTYQQEAERVAVDRLVGTLRTALSIKIAQLSVAKREQELQSVIDENPMTWLVEPPENYLGEYYSPEGNSLSGGVWYFDRSSKELVYRPTATKSFRFKEQVLLKFKVKFLYLPMRQGKSPGPPSMHKAAVLDQVSEETDVNN